MKLIATLTTVLLSAILNAQPLRDTSTVNVDLHLAGRHIERAGVLRGDGLTLLLIMGAVGAYETQRKSETDRIIGWSTLAATGGGYITLQFLIAGKERKAGRILQGKSQK